MSDATLMADTEIARILATLVLRVVAMVVGCHLLGVGARVAGAAPATSLQAAPVSRTARTGGILLMSVGVFLVLDAALSKLP